MLSAIKLNNQMCGFTAKVDDIAVDRNLPPEFHAMQTAISQPKPKLAFGVGLLLP